MSWESDFENDDEYDTMSRPPTPGSNILTDDDLEAGRYVRMPLNHRMDWFDENGPSSAGGDAADGRSEACVPAQCSEELVAATPSNGSIGAEKAEANDRLASLEKRIVELSRLLAEKQSSEKPTTADQSWAAPSREAEAAGPSSSIRMDHIPPFPKDVPSNGMWEAFNRYLEKFEIALAIYNISDPVKRAQYLYLATGDDLQSIVRGAGLRPSLQDPDCYKKMVANIAEYFRAMTDPTAELEAFAKLKQERGEPTVTFHARLVSKAQQCGRSPKEQEHSVRIQLLRGMANQELARAARTFDYDTSFVVQSAARSEAFEAEAKPGASSDQIFAVKEFAPRDRKRNHHGQQNGVADKRRRFAAPLHKRDRCSRCDRAQHKGKSCPALDRDCRQCGRRGHFAATCRMKKIERVEKVEPLPFSEDEKV